jgi:hypothetical protein
MVNGDHRWRGLRVVVCTALFACGCLQTQPGGGSSKVATAFGFNSPRGGAADDATFAVAVAKPGRPGAASRTAEPPPADGGDPNNPVQAASAKQDPAGEQAPAPRPQPPDPAGQPPAAGQPAKDPANPAAPAPPAQRPLNNRYAPDPMFPLKKPQSGQPGASGVVQAGGVPPVDPHARTVPSVGGALLNLPPGESPAERALELNARLAAADADRHTLEVRARELTAALEARDQSLAQHSRDIHEAVEEVASARVQVTAWRKELEDARARLRSRELEDVQTLKAIITLLERLTEPSPAPDGRREGATRAPEE